jgi:SPP1 gp7 family putative phage head morphogenesis protein
MIDFPTDVRERELRLLVARIQYERHVATLASELVERELNRVVDILVSGKYRTLTSFQRQRLAELFRELDRTIREGYAGIATAQTQELQAYAQLESDVARATAATILSTGGSALTVGFYRLPQSYLNAIAKLPIDGLKLGDWFARQAATMSIETRRIIQQGLIEGKAPIEISRRIIADARVQGAVLSRRATNEARIVARTAVNAVQNDAQLASLAALPPDISDSYMIVAVRDIRTSTICRALDGRVYKYSDPNARKPPFHLNCRTSIRALIRGAEITLGIQKTPASFRSYSDWLTAQPKTVQNEILGATRADWFRDGKMSLADAIDADNRVLTLAQLRQKLGLTNAARALATA